MIKYSLSNQLEHINNTFYDLSIVCRNNLNMLIILPMIKHSLSNQLEHVYNTFYDLT